MSPAKGRKPGIPDSLIIQRIEYAVELKYSGLSTITIHEKINLMAPSKGWGEISMRQLKRDFAAYYRDASVTNFEDKDYIKAMRELFLHELEILMERLNQRIKSKKDWQPFEYEKSMKLLFDMKVKYADLQNWNESKHKEHTLKINSSDKSEFGMLEQAGEELMRMNPKVKEELLLKPLSAYIDSVEGSNDESDDEVLDPNRKALKDYFETLIKNAEEE